MSIVSKFGHRIREVRKSHGLSQEGLAEASGLHRTYISSLERGERNPTLITIEALSKALDVEVSDLLRGLNDD